MECKVKNENGTIYIAEDVMCKVVGYAALECYGIVAMSGQKATDGIVEWLGRENLTKGVQIRNVGDMLDVDLYIIVEYGISISEVCKTIVETVRYKLVFQLVFSMIRLVATTGKHGVKVPFFVFPCSKNRVSDLGK